MRSGTYKCSDCGHEWKAIGAGSVSMDIVQDVLTHCPRCKGQVAELRVSQDGTMKVDKGREEP